MDRESGVVIRIGRLRLPIEESRYLAHAAAQATCYALKGQGAPHALRLEIDRVQTTEVVNRSGVRTLLPHHDGQHRSYLTPSLVDVPDWNPQHRTFSDSGFSTTMAHKLYQGIFVLECGEGLSVTTYYNWLAVLNRGFEHSTGDPARSTSELAGWLGANIVRSLNWQPEHGCRYLSVGAALGSHRLIHHGVSCHTAEAEFAESECSRFPKLRDFHSCLCGTCPAPAQRMLCDMLVHTTGLTYPQFRNQFEVCVPSELGDLVMGRNLRLVHGGLMGGEKRLLEPLCLVVDRPAGPITNRG